MHKIIPFNAILVPDTAQRVFAGQIFDVYQWQQRLFDGRNKTFELLKRPDTVQALIIKDGKLLMVHDDQPHRGMKLTLPGGRADQGEASWLEAVQREVSEETGMSFKNWRLLQVQQPQQKIEWFCALYLAWDVSSHRAPRHDQGGEKIEVVAFSFAEAKEHLMADMRLQYIRPLFEKLDSLGGLMALPEFRGQPADR